ncbi:endonuclease/exonuclease/phosphatase (EEP) superfamily protein YafD [Catalinimonas alkaloidigena]|uniref:endonuclease/exonuclease/phosphatase family protein n=1 Tax=Catalinimonas alkaloidigena TaxID=1075417 RepID=UPI002406C36F|nr:endonuclease/exonuclease/phosphatase family protein [Catalinimonas alkaloidigena]MDF9799023.1 endonuclease/exonuclease/phosphatase (EEP) superfamily protein YafD [Catalinimonas alkaloidigena]
MKKNILCGLTLVGVLTFGLGFLGSLSWLLDLFTHFRVYFLLYFFLLLTIAFIRKQKVAFLINALLSLFIITSLYTFYFPAPEETAAQGLKVCSINLLTSNHQYDEVIRYIEEEDFDIILFLEFNSRWAKALDELFTAYPYTHQKIREDNFGIALMSRLPLENSEVLILSKANMPTLVSDVRYEGRVLQIIGTHPVPPVGAFQFEARNEQFSRLNQLVKDSEKEVLLLGDLNCSSFSPNFKRISEGTKLRDSRQGFGLLPSWHARWFFLSVSIDHALLSEGVEVKARGTGPFIGSDHLPLEIVIDWKE